MNCIKSIVFATLLGVGLAFWGPHAVEKFVTVDATKPGAAAVQPLDIFYNQVPSISEVLMRLERLDARLGTDLVSLPDAGSALRFDELPAEVKPHYIAAARSVLLGFGWIEAFIVMLMVSALVAAMKSVNHGFLWLFGGYSLGVALGCIMLAAHILLGIRPNVASQTSFWTLNLIGELACAAITVSSMRRRAHRPFGRLLPWKAAPLEQHKAA